jgi:hypothetical protein
VRMEGHSYPLELLACAEPRSYNRCSASSCRSYPRVREVDDGSIREHILMTEPSTRARG